MSFDLAYAPSGETYAPSGSTDPAFTGQRQDTVSDVYDFPAREYRNEGRWSSPDPSGIAAFHLTDPQSYASEERTWRIRLIEGCDFSTRYQQISMEHDRDRLGVLRGFASESTRV